MRFYFVWVHVKSAVAAHTNTKTGVLVSVYLASYGTFYFALFVLAVVMCC